jgi:predicted homoserine dehydrogenase-like protein
VRALPIGLSEGCVLRRNVSKDDTLSFDDVDAPAGGLAWTLWREQSARWPSAVRERPAAQRVPAEALSR